MRELPYWQELMNQRPSSGLPGALPSATSTATSLLTPPLPIRAYLLSPEPSLQRPMRQPVNSTKLASAATPWFETLLPTAGFPARAKLERDKAKALFNQEGWLAAGMDEQRRRDAVQAVKLLPATWPRTGRIHLTSRL